MYVVFDIGGTNTRIGVSDDAISIDNYIIYPSIKNYQDGVSFLKQKIALLTKGAAIKGFSGGLAGPFNREKTMLVTSPHLPDWVLKPLKDDLEKTYQAPVFLNNETALVGLGEAHYGAGRGYNIVAYLSISSGVGGVRIVSGKIDNNAFGFEPGHQIITHPALEGDDPDIVKDKAASQNKIHNSSKKDAAQGVVTQNNKRNYFGTLPKRYLHIGHLEGYVSGAAIEKHFGKKPYQLDDKAIWNQLLQVLAYGINNTLVYWSPDVVVLGGGVMKNIIPMMETLMAHVHRVVTIFPNIPPITVSQLGDIGGLYGALVSLKEKQTGVIQ